MGNKNVIDVRAIVKEYLINKGYDGLCKKSQEELIEGSNFFGSGWEHQCSCEISDLICCIDSAPEECFPGYKVPLMPQMDKMDSRDGRLNELDWYISTKHADRQIDRLATIMKAHGWIVRYRRPRPNRMGFLKSAFLCVLRVLIGKQNEI